MLTKAIFDKITNFEIQVIPDITRFWMIRTQKGYFYEEFIKKEFVALGWNFISKDTDLGKQSIDTIKEELKDEYGEKRPMGPVNKCKNFIFEIKAGDILLIPNSGGSIITIAEAGEYYEDSEKTVDIELETITKIKRAESEINTVSCPYRKRRKITILQTVDKDRMGYDLRRAISTYHGISCFDEYAEDILNCVYDSYSFKENVLFSINVAKKSPIRPREISRLMYSTSEFFCEIADEDILSTTINLNSPGKVVMKLQGGFKYLTKNTKPFICIFFLITGGSALGFEFPGLVGVIKEARCMEIDIEEKRVSLEGEKLDNTLKAIEIVKNAKEAGMNIDSILNSLSTLDSLNVDLQFEPNEQFQSATPSYAKAEQEN